MEMIIVQTMLEVAWLDRVLNLTYTNKSQNTHDLTMLLDANKLRTISCTYYFLFILLKMKN